jgi:hypothetical protein
MSCPVASITRRRMPASVARFFCSLAACVLTLWSHIKMGSRLRFCVLAAARAANVCERERRECRRAEAPIAETLEIAEGERASDPLSCAAPDSDARANGPLDRMPDDGRGTRGAGRAAKTLRGDVERSTSSARSVRASVDCSSESLSPVRSMGCSTSAAAAPGERGSGIKTFSWSVSAAEEDDGDNERDVLASWPLSC